MNHQSQILEAAVQGAAYGFGKGYLAAVENLRVILSLVPDDKAKNVFSNLTLALEGGTNDALVRFLEKLEFVVYETDNNELEINAFQ